MHLETTKVQQIQSCPFATSPFPAHVHYSGPVYSLTLWKYNTLLRWSSLHIVTTHPATRLVASSMVAIKYLAPVWVCLWVHFQPNTISISRENFHLTCVFVCVVYRDRKMLVDCCFRCVYWKFMGINFKFPPPTAANAAAGRMVQFDIFPSKCASL